jgi:hypothetical protein
MGHHLKLTLFGLSTLCLGFILGKVLTKSQHPAPISVKWPVFGFDFPHRAKSSAELEKSFGTSCGPNSWATTCRFSQHDVGDRKVTVVMIGSGSGTNYNSFFVYLGIGKEWQLVTCKQNGFEGISVETEKNPPEIRFRSANNKLVLIIPKEGLDAIYRHPGFS